MVNQISIDDITKVWDFWRTEWHNRSGEFDACWFGYSSMEDETGVDVKTLKKIMKLFRDLKLSYWGPTISNDYEISGSGNFIKDSYLEKDSEWLKAIINKAAEAVEE